MYRHASPGSPAWRPEIWLFARRPRRARAARTFLTLIDSAKCAGLNAWDYFLDVSYRIGDHPANRLDELLPNNWKAVAELG